MSSVTDFTIIGGGINGLMTARELLKTGATVTLIDKNLTGRESSWAGGGILLPLYPWRQDQAITELVKISIKLYPTLNQQLLEKTGIDPEWTESGMLIAKNPDIQLAKSWCKTNNIRYHSATETQCKPFNTDTLHPLWLPSIAQIRNPRLLKALIKELKSHNASFIENCLFEAVHIENDLIHSISTSSGTVPVNQLILTAGAWTGELWQTLFGSTMGISPEIFPVKGQMLIIDTEPDLLTLMILDGDRYLIPRRDGKILVGSTVEKTGFDKAVSLSSKRKLSDFAISLIPALDHYPVLQHWAGVRPGTKSGIPYIDIHPEINNLSINAGHFRNGLVMAPASAQLLVDLLLNRTPSLNPGPYQLSAEH